jgi:hypothetical protein
MRSQVADRGTWENKFGTNVPGYRLCRPCGTALRPVNDTAIDGYFVYPLHDLNTIRPQKTGHLLARRPVHGKITYWMVRVNVVEAVMFGLLLSVAVTVTV